MTTFIIIFFFVFLFFLKTGRKRMMTMFWSGEKARKKRHWKQKAKKCQKYRMTILNIYSETCIKWTPSGNAVVLIQVSIVNVT